MMLILIIGILFIHIPVYFVVRWCNESWLTGRARPFMEDVLATIIIIEGTLMFISGVAMICYALWQAWGIK